MVLKIFIFGRPGCGKSLAAHVISDIVQRQGWHVERFNDYEFLQNMFREEQKEKCRDKQPARFRPTDYEGFDILDFTVLDLALDDLKQRIENYLPTQQSRDVLIIEFARDDYDQPMQSFSLSFLHDAHILFIETRIEICIQRIYERVSHPYSADDHFVSKEALQNYYQQQHFAANYLVKSSERITNTGTQEAFKECIQEYIRTLLTP